MSESFVSAFFKQAWRSLWRNKRRTLITISAIAFGLFLATTFLSLGNGMYAKLTDEAVRIHGYQPNPVAYT